ncbi:MAG: integron integrase [Candidatus Omnitrophica bacterium]|nr:integron integrase [Candidatus Omnitrophota bacterium]MBU2265678.1 integron integrase [Candidatus Omnitrophota bacterium]
MFRDVLPDFQRFLVSQHIVSQRYVNFYAYWVSRFITFSNYKGLLDFDESSTLFFQHLIEKGKLADWQINQAKEAVKLYLESFLREKKSGNHPPAVNLDNNYLIIADQLRQAMRLKHYSRKTEKSYLGWVKRFFSFLIMRKAKGTIQELKDSDVKDYLSYLATDIKVSASTQNQAFNALLFMFRNILSKDLKDLNKVVRAKPSLRLPVVLSIEEVQIILQNSYGRDLLILQLLYGAGFRLAELLRLRVQDIDFSQNLIFIRASKGDKDRTTIFPEAVKEKLRRHLGVIKNIHERDLASGYGEVYLPDSLSRKYPNSAKEWKWQYAFASEKLSIDPESGKIRRHHISEKVVQKAISNAVIKAGIAKHVTAHTFRHSFATHLLMKGVNIRQIQELLGHKYLETTMIYTHVIKDIASTPKSPLDDLCDNSKSSKKYYLK